MKNKSTQTGSSSRTPISKWLPRAAKLLPALCGMSLAVNVQADDASFFGKQEVSLAPNQNPIASASPSEPTTPKTTRNEISVSADFMQGYGTLTLPVGFSIKQDPILGGPLPAGTVRPGDRDSTFYGGTISYSRGQTWYFDFGYANGTSDATSEAPFFLGSANLRLKLQEDYFSAYIRYAFPSLRGTRLSAYARAGLTYNNAEMDVSNPSNDYRQRDEFQDILGNLGFGLTYSLYSTPQNFLRVSLNFEGEGFMGYRSQQSTEELDTNGDGTLDTLPTVDLDNVLFGSIGRSTVRFQLRLNKSGLARAFLDLGMQGKYTQIRYEQINKNESLWGPYAKLGFRYSF